jgi:ribonuclease P protein component
MVRLEDQRGSAPLFIKRGVVRWTRAEMTGPRLAASDEKDLSTTQPPSQADARISGTHGDTGRKKHNQAPAGQGAPAAGRGDSSQAAGLRTSARAGLGKNERLRKRAEFLSLQRRGARAQSGHFVLYALPGTAGERSKLGLTVSRRIGSAVTRNRVKRQVRECFRLKLRTLLPEGVAMVVIARKGAGELDSATIAAELGSATTHLADKLAAGHAPRS